jgi:hypothetical protein
MKAKLFSPFLCPKCRTALYVSRVEGARPSVRILVHLESDDCPYSGRIFEEPAIGLKEICAAT